MAKLRTYPNRPMENGKYRIEDIKSVYHHLHVPQSDHDKFREKLKKNGWDEVDNRCVMDAHEEWTKGHWTCTFPGCWTRKKEDLDVIGFETTIISGHTDYTKEEWDAWWENRKNSGYVVAPESEIASNPTVKLCDVKFKPYRILERAQARMKEAIDLNGSLFFKKDK